MVMGRCRCIYLVTRVQSALELDFLQACYSTVRHEGTAFILRCSICTATSIIYLIESD